ncbi:hypothetical protein FOMG_19783 [Fusarium oxysporum f. sp. melonis 26406]|uniref:Uncharacterized protein n=1 Tax=Fusarium oxysporum f. sp. melonis 26406 TaxID=1089452 RepID=W9Z467_FUSOX|nr:hypothetical protein FOMG_19783 [Fusarium oxysporum f. sp. melonis 26406]
MKSRLERIGGYKEHRGHAFDRHILPRCRPLAESIGNRMAYEAAEKWGLPSEVLTLAAGPRTSTVSVLCVIQYRLSPDQV